jgi:predicted Zn-dependent protease
VLLEENEARAIVERLLARSRAEGCEIVLRGGREHNLRFVREGATTNRTAEEISLRISSHVDVRVGSVEIAALDEDACTAALAQSEEIARALPKDPEYVPPLGPQNYQHAERNDEATARIGLVGLAARAGVVMAEGRRRGVDTFGQIASSAGFVARGTSAGLFAYDRRSEIEMSATARNRTDAWSGWGGAKAHRAELLDAESVAHRACAKAAWSEPPRDLEPGSWTTIFEPEATAELARWLLRALDQRAADEGRNCFAKKGGGNLCGELLFDPKFSLRSDPGDALAPECPIGWEGVPQRARAWVDGGRLASLYLDRAYARKIGAEPIPCPGSFRVGGGAVSLADMIASTKRGVLVTRLWYTNMLDPRALLLTGLTRDGNFLIENGRIVAPARNLRFNQSLSALFSKIEALSAEEPTWSALYDHGVAAAPAMMVEGFNISSKSSGI